MPDPVTLVYKTIYAPNSGSEGDTSAVLLHLDVYLPTSHSSGTSASGRDDTEIPAVVYFHGGGLLVGNRRSWFPDWLHGRLSTHGVAFLSGDYRLLLPSTGHDILEDIQDLFVYIRNDLNSALAGVTGNPKLRIDTDVIAVAGTSSGALCAYLCSTHLPQKPRALLSMYGQAGECLNDTFLEPKTKPFLAGRPLIDPTDFSEFLFPRSASLPITAESPLEYCPPTHPTPGLPVTKRMYLTRLYYQLGEWLDCYTGDHTLSARLRQLRSPASSESGVASYSVIDPIRAREAIGEKNVVLFPQFGVTENWPPTFIVHGSNDTQVTLPESKNIAGMLTAAGVENELIVVEGKGHSFDYAPGAEVELGGTFDCAAAFLLRHLQR